MSHRNLRRQPPGAVPALILFAGAASAGASFPLLASAQAPMGATGQAVIIGPPTPAIYQDAFVKASNTGKGDNFGRATAYANDTLVVGAPFRERWRRRGEWRSGG